MKLYYHCIGVLLLFGVSSLWALTPKELAVSINLAGKQRMLTQKMTKEALLIQQGIDSDQNYHNLKETMQRFNRTLYGLLHGDPTLKLKACQNADVQKALKAVDQVWQPMRSNIQKILTGNATAQTYKVLQQQNIEVLQKMHEAVGRYVNQNDTSHYLKAQTINLAGKERMLTQKIAKSILEGDTTERQEAQKEFESILNALLYGDKKTGLSPTTLPQIKKLLLAAQTLWHEVRPSLHKKTLNKQEIKQSIQTLDAIMTLMDKAVTAYEKSVRKARRASQLSTLVDQFMQKQNSRYHLINLAGRQRMLTQEMVKSALLVTLGIQPEQNKKVMQKAADTFSQTLQGMYRGDERLGISSLTDTKARQQLDHIQNLWKPFVRQLDTIRQSRQKEPESLAYLITHDRELLQACNQLVQRLKQQTPQEDFIQKAHDNIIDIAGRQRMLIQKMTKEKLLILAKINPQQNRTKLQQDIETFDDVLHALKAGDPSQKIPKPANPQLRAQLQKVSALWEKLRPVYTTDSPDKKSLALMLAQHTKLLTAMDRSVRYYEELADY